MNPEPPPAGANSTIAPNPQQRISHDLDVVALQVHGQVLPDARLAELAQAFERRTWWITPLEPARIGPEQYARVKALLTDAITARGGRHQVGSITWRSDGRCLWAELGG